MATKVASFNKNKRVTKSADSGYLLGRSHTVKFLKISKNSVIVKGYNPRKQCTYNIMYCSMRYKPRM